MTKDQERAHHEAGHAVAAWAVYGTNVVRVAFLDDGSGVCSCDTVAPNPLGELLVAQAGGAVDDITIGAGSSLFTIGNARDVMRIGEVLREMGYSDAIDDPERDAVWERSARCAARFVKLHFHLVTRVADALAERCELTGDDLRELLPADLENTLYRPQPKRGARPKAGQLTLIAE